MLNYRKKRQAESRRRQQSDLVCKERPKEKPFVERFIVFRKNVLSL
jgi:hypothetical protein